tara:strand:+ start:1326 stop:1520 length:195 start_codon:yes stop_codon:yes gene_type:complete
MKTYGETKENIHYWFTIPQGDLMVSDENTKTLKCFKTIDDAVNWLFLNGFKESARQLNKNLKKN